MKINFRLIDILNANKDKIISIFPTADDDCIYKGYINEFDKSFIDIQTVNMNNLYIAWEFVESFSFETKREGK